MYRRTAWPCGVSSRRLEVHVRLLDHAPIDRRPEDRQLRACYGPRPGRRPRRNRGSRRRPRSRPCTSPGAGRPGPGPASAPGLQRPRQPGSPARPPASGCRWCAAGTRTRSPRRSCRRLRAGPRRAPRSPSREARTTSPAAVTTSKDSTLSQVSPHWRASQPIPPPRVRPPTPVCETLPAVVASPYGWVATSSAPSRAPPCTHARRRSGSTRDPAHGGQVDHQPALRHRVPGHTVPAAPDADLQAIAPGQGAPRSPRRRVS